MLDGLTTRQSWRWPPLKGGEKMATFEVYFDDLCEEAQERYLEFQGVKDPAELNAEFSPICIVERSDEDEADE